MKILKRKKSVTLLLALFFTTIILNCGKASAFSNDVYTASADTLFNLGLFMGTDAGYELERVPTRLEAAVMLTRFLGKEQEALEAESYSAPFTDVPEWGKQYVNYLWANKLTNGVSATNYDPSSACTVKMYCAFMVRALGYADGSDFNYDYADAFALKIGIADKYILTDTFNRGSMAAISELALTVRAKGSNAALLEKLSATGAVPSGTEFSEQVRHFNIIKNAFSQIVESGGYDISVEYIFTNDEYWDAFSTASLLFQYSYQNGILKFAYADNEMNNIYYLNGNIYYSFPDGSKYYTPMRQSDALDQLAPSVEHDGLLNILHTIGTDKEAGNMVYWFSYSEAEFPDVAAAILGVNWQTEFPELSIRDIRSEMHISPGGKLVKQVTMLRGEYSSAGSRLIIQAYEEINIYATGASVVVTYPDDLNKYQYLN